MDNFEIKVSKVKQLSCLLTVEVLGLTEVYQVLMVCKDLDGEWRSVKAMPLGLQSADDSEELPVIDVIVSFCRDD